MIFCFVLLISIVIQILLVNLWNLNKWSIEPDKDLGISNYVKSIQSNNEKD